VVTGPQQGLRDVVAIRHWRWHLRKDGQLFWASGEMRT
ncbi:hypothetical protein PSYPI_48355, partial [Pseudomonas syringae pv. pisi str. 1704B]